MNAPAENDIDLQRKLLSSRIDKNGCLMVPDEIKFIYPNVLENNNDIKSIIMHDTVEHVGDYAFSECKNLSDITMSKSLKEIGYYAFEGCNISSIDLPESINRIEAFAFTNNNLKEINIPKNIEWLDQNISDENTNIIFPSDLKMEVLMTQPFFEKHASENMIPNGIKSLGYDCFYGANIEKINIPDTVEALNYGVFDYSKLKTIWLPESIKKIDKPFAQNCENLKMLKLPKDITFDKEGDMPTVDTVCYAGKNKSVLDMLHKKCNHIVTDENQFADTQKRFASISKITEFNEKETMDLFDDVLNKHHISPEYVDILIDSLKEAESCAAGNKMYPKEDSSINIFNDDIKQKLQLEYGAPFSMVKENINKVSFYEAETIILKKHEAHNDAIAILDELRHVESISDYEKYGLDTQIKNLTFKSLNTEIHSDVTNDFRHFFNMNSSNVNLPRIMGGNLYDMTVSKAKSCVVSYENASTIDSLKKQTSDIETYIGDEYGCDIHVHVGEEFETGNATKGVPIIVFSNSDNIDDVSFENIESAIKDSVDRKFRIESVFHNVPVSESAFENTVTAYEKSKNTHKTKSVSYNDDKKPSVNKKECSLNESLISQKENVNSDFGVKM